MKKILFFVSLIILLTGCSEEQKKKEAVKDYVSTVDSTINWTNRAIEYYEDYKESGFLNPSLNPLDAQETGVSVLRNNPPNYFFDGDYDISSIDEDYTRAMYLRLHVFIEFTELVESDQVDKIDFPYIEKTINETEEIILNVREQVIGLANKYEVDLEQYYRLRDN